MLTLLFARHFVGDDGGGNTNRPSDALPDDHIVVHRVRTGDVTMFAQLFRVYAARLASFVYRYLRSREDAEDVVQELFLRIWRSRETWQVRGSVNDYLYLAARNQARDRLAHRAVVDRHRAFELYNSTSSMAAEPNGGPDDGEWQAMLTRALDELPARRRDICILRWRDGLSYADIAHRLGVSPKTVENQLARALKTLRERLVSFWP